MVKGTKNKRLDSLFAELESIKEMAEWTGYDSKAKSLHPYIRGLLLSKLLIKEIKKELSKTYSVSWGQLINADKELSKEVDIIIFKKKPTRHWEVIDYSIIPEENALALIECKTQIASGTKKLYKELEEISRFSPDYYLFTEENYGGESSFKQKRLKFIEKGFKDIFTLSLSYQEDHGWTFREPYYEDWNRLLDLINSL